jgi:hypothetical protein
VAHRGVVYDQIGAGAETARLAWVCFLFGDARLRIIHLKAKRRHPLSVAFTPREKILTLHKIMHRQAAEPGGFKAISRRLSEAAPPVEEQNSPNPNRRVGRWMIDRAANPPGSMRRDTDAKGAVERC